MALPTITGEALVVGQEGATLRHVGQNQTPVSNARLKFSDRKRQDDGSYVDGAVLWIDATAWGQEAEQLAELGQPGTVLVVHGRVDTQEWEDKQSGQKRSKPRLTIEMLKPKYADRKPAQQPAPAQGFGQQNTGQPDPWGGSGAGWGDNSRPAF